MDVGLAPMILVEGDLLRPGKGLYDPLTDAEREDLNKLYYCPADPDAAHKYDSQHKWSRGEGVKVGEARGYMVQPCDVVQYTKVCEWCRMSVLDRRKERRAREGSRHG